MTSCWALALSLAGSAQSDLPIRIRASRLAANPIISEKMLPGSDGDSINGPSLIRVPAWVQSPLGKYYLYFAHHAGKYIRLAYADRLEGPWKIHPGGVLSTAGQKLMAGHIASPDVVIDEADRQIYLFFHGKPSAARPKGDKAKEEEEAGQRTSVAVSTGGIHFQPLEVNIGPAYLRLFRHGGNWCALNGHGDLLCGASLRQPFQLVARIIGDDIKQRIDPVRLGEPGARAERPASGPDRYAIRHVGVDIAGRDLLVYFSCVGHRPERIFCTRIERKPDPAQWRAAGVQEILRPEHAWEGVDLPLAYSQGGRSRAWENGLRDPAIFVEDGRRWLLYSTAGEHGIGIAELHYEGLK